MKNKYVQRSRISEKKFKEILRFFVADLQANQISQITGLSRNSINAYFKAMRFSIVSAYTQYNSYTRVPLGFPQLYAIQQKEQQIILDPLPSHITQNISQALKNQENTLVRNILQEHYNALLDYSHKKLYTFHEVSTSQNAQHFWHFTRQRLSKFRGISAQNTLLHLKECEFRYNYQYRDIYRMLLNHFRKHPLHF